VIRSKVLLLTSPAYVTSRVLSTSTPPTSNANSATTSDSAVLPEAQSLENINYPAVASVTLAYPNTAFKVRLNTLLYYLLTLY
jgi:hypothetical protein